MDWEWTMESMYTECEASLYTQVGVYGLLVNIMESKLESTRSDNHCLSINSVHRIPVQVPQSPCDSCRLPIVSPGVPQDGLGSVKPFRKY